MKATIVSRRDFLKSTGLTASGLILGFRIGNADSHGSGVFNPNAFIAINAESGVHVYIPIPEIGQNTRTALSMIICDELEADLDTITIHQTGPRTDMPFQNAGGSNGVRRTYDDLRNSAATVREMLKAGAASQWKVMPDKCRAEKSYIYGPGSRKMSFEDAVPLALKQSVPEKPSLKASRDFHYIGTDVRIKDARDIGRGKTAFSSDAMPEGVRFAVVIRCPVWQGKLKSYDASAAKSFKDVVDVVKIGDKIAVVATNTWSAMKASELVAVDWEEGEHAEASTDKLTVQQKDAVSNPDRDGFKQADFESAYAGAAIQLEEEFSAPILAHSPMETPNCTVWYHDGGVEIWTGCQSLTRLVGQLPEYTGLPWDKIKFHQLRIGGGFGRKLAHDYIIEAVDIAKQVNYPVKLIFSKADDLRHSVYRASDRLRYRVGLKENGYPVALQEFGSRSTRQRVISKIGLFFENIEKRFAIVAPPVITGPMRAPNDNVTSFTEQSMIDCMAKKAGIDPMTYRLALHGDKDSLKELGWGRAPVDDKEFVELLRIVRKRSGWKSDPNYGYGVSFFEKYGSHIAIVALAPKAASTRVIEKVYAAVNCGRIINTLSARAQVEGAIIDGLAAALYQKIDIRNGQVVQSNYHDYKMLAITQTPEIDIHLVESEDQPQGIGETGYPPMMPATVSAIYDATGRRTRDLPVY